jgi:hypothetical protein
VADFVTVMSQFMRLCDSYENCDNCPVCQAGFNCACDYQGYSKTGAVELEHIIMSWAAEHPEPIYPTWEQYLADLMTADMKADKTDNPNSVENYMRKTRIPADIAQKLGIEPKEG